MANIMTIDLKNLQSNADNFKVVSFPSRIKIVSMSFSVNGEAAGSPELGRIWRLYCAGGHPTPTPENPWSEWITPVFNATEEKPTIDNAEASFYSTVSQPFSFVTSKPGADPFIKYEMNWGVFAPNDYMAVWVALDSGDVETIVWDETEATLNISYEETAMRTPYEMIQEHPWLD